MPCKYFAPNGKESKLFTSLFSHFKEQGNNDTQAELKAARLWLETFTPYYKKEFDGQRDENGEPLPYYLLGENDPEAVAITEFIRPNSSARALLWDLTDSPDEHIRFLAARIQHGQDGNNVPVVLRTRDELNGQFPQLLQRKVVNAFYDPKSQTIYVNSETVLTKPQFEALMLEEITHAQTAHVINSNKEAAAEWNTLYGSIKRYLSAQGVKHRALANPTEMLYAALQDKDFRQLLRQSKMPAQPNSLWHLILDFIAKALGFRQRNYLQLEQVLAVAEQVLDQSLREPMVVSKDGELIFNDEETVKIQNQVNPGAPKAHLLSGDPIIDKYIIATHEKIRTLRDELAKRGKQADNARILREIKKYQRDLRELTDTKAVEILVNVGQREVMRMENDLAEDLTLNELGANHKLMEAWSDFSSMVKAEEGSELQQRIRDISVRASELKAEFDRMYLAKLKKRLGEQGVPVTTVEQIDPQQVIEDIGSMTASFIGISFSDNPYDIAADFIIRNTAFQINKELDEFDHRLKTLMKEAGIKDLDFIFEAGEDGKLRPKTKYKRELYEKLQELKSNSFKSRREIQPLMAKSGELTAKYFKAIGQGDKAAAEAINTERKAVQAEIDEFNKKHNTMATLNEFMRQNFDYVLTDEGRADHQRVIDSLQDDFMDYNPESGEFELNERAYKKALADHSLEAIEKWLETGEGYVHPATQFFTITPKKQWLAGHTFSASQQKVYDFFVEEYLSAQANVPMDYSYSDYTKDTLLREFAYMDEATASRFQYLKQEIKDTLKDAFTVQNAKPVVDTDEEAPFSKDPTKKVRFKGVREFINPEAGYIYEWENVDKLPSYIQSGIKDGRYKWKDGILVGAKMEKPIHKKNLESDPLKIFTNFKKFSLAYAYKKEVEDVLLGVKEAVAITSISSKKHLVGDMMGMARGKQRGSELEKRIAYNIDAFMQGHLKDPIEGDKEGPAGKRSFSAVKTIETINNITRVRQMGLNPVSGLSNWMMGTANNFIYAARDEFFNETHLREAYWVLKSSVLKAWSLGGAITDEARKVALLAKEFNILGNFRDSMMMDDKMVEDALNKLFVFQEKGEYLNQTATLIAMMKKQIVKDAGGRPMRSLWDSYEVKDGRLHFKFPEADYADPQKQFIFAAAVSKVNKEIHGDYDTLNPMLFKKGIWGRVFMLFRTWMPQAIKTRMGARYEDYQLSMLKGEKVYREGRWRTMANAFRYKGMGDVAVNAASFLSAVILSTVSNRLARKVVDGMHISPADRANINANVKEAWYLMMLTLATLALKGMIEDDEDEKKDSQKVSWLKYIYNQTARLDTELWFFYDPISFAKIAKDAVPLWSTLKQGMRVWDSGWTLAFDPEEDIYKKGFRKGDSKFLTQLQLFAPITKQGQSLWSMSAQMFSDNNY